MLTLDMNRRILTDTSLAAVVCADMITDARSALAEADAGRATLLRKRVLRSTCQRSMALRGTQSASMN